MTKPHYIKTLSEPAARRYAGECVAGKLQAAWLAESEIEPRMSVLLVLSVRIEAERARKVAK